MPRTTLSKSKYRKLLAKHLLTKGLKEVTIMQRRPITIAFIKAETPDGKAVVNVGVSKVCHPDRWNPIYGRKLAVIKAVNNAAKDIVNVGLPDATFTARHVWKDTDINPNPFKDDFELEPPELSTQ